MQANPQVAATIQEDYHDWTTIQGIQLEGVVRRLAGGEREAAIDGYGARFSFLARPAPVVEAALARVEWYLLTPHRLYFIDNRKGFGHRDELTLGHAA
jgi:uncharacterized protein YhbP (UPF0306 family)